MLNQVRSSLRRLLYRPLWRSLYRLSGARLHLGIGSNGIALACTGAGWKKNMTVIADQVRIPNQLKNQCDTLLAHPSCSTLPLSITLGNECGRLFIVTPPQNTEHYSDLIAAAKMRFQTLYGKGSDDWQIEAEWQMSRPFLACAYPRLLLTTLHQVAKEHNSPLLSIKPYFVTAWNDWCSKLHSAAWFGVVENDVITVGITSARPSLTGIRSISIPADGHTSEWMLEQLTRIALQNNSAVPKQIMVVGNFRDYWREKEDHSDQNQLVINLEAPLLSSLTKNPSTNTLSPAMQLLLSSVSMGAIENVDYHLPPTSRDLFAGPRMKAVSSNTSVSSHCGYQATRHKWFRNWIRKCFKLRPSSYFPRTSRGK